MEQDRSRTLNFRYDTTNRPTTWSLRFFPHFIAHVLRNCARLPFVQLVQAGLRRRYFGIQSHGVGEIDNSLSFLFLDN